jgi:hypothetical protein
VDPKRWRDQLRRFYLTVGGMSQIFTSF